MKYPNRAKGGFARAEKLSPERRKEIARLGGSKRGTKKAAIETVKWVSEIVSAGK